MADFYAARDTTMTPLPWPSIAPPFTLGDPIERDGATVIPIVSYGFGFGAGGNTGAKNGTGAGTGGGGGIKPLGAIIFDKDGARVEAVKGALTNVAEVIGETAAHVMKKPSTAKDSTKA